MPVFKYLVLNQSDPPEYIEVEQSVNDSLYSNIRLPANPSKELLILQV